MNQPSTFSVFDCSLARRATGRFCTNLRELLEAVRSVPEGVLEHHMMRCALEDHFELYEFPNDLARWCWNALGDHVVGEHLGLTNPYRYCSIEELRSELVNVLEDRLWGLDRVPWCRPGMELQLIQSRLIAYDTGERITDPRMLGDAISRMSRRSLFYHVHEARRRTGLADDFTLWLEQGDVPPELVAELRAVDFYFLNLSQLREELVGILHRYFPEAAPAVKDA